MAKIQIKSETRHEFSFFPNSFDDYVPKDSKVRMVDHIIRSMYIIPLMDTYDGIGAPPYSPKMLLSLVVFAYINGVYSCRGIADALKYDVRYMCDRFFGKLHQTHIEVTDNLLPLFVQPFL